MARTTEPTAPAAREDRILAAVKLALNSKTPERLTEAAQLLMKMADCERAEQELLRRLPPEEKPAPA